MTYDIRLTDDFDLPESEDFVEGVELWIQAIKIRLIQGLGEWPLDTSQGLPFERWLETLPPPLNEFRELVTAELLTATGVTRLSSVEAEFDFKTRTLVYSAEVVFETGDRAQVTLNGGPGARESVSAYLLPRPGTPIIY